MTVIDFTLRRVKKHGAREGTFLQRREAAYNELADYFMEHFQPKYAQDDVSIGVFVQIAADLVRVGRNRPEHGEDWAKHFVAVFVERAKMPYKE